MWSFLKPAPWFGCGHPYVDNYKREFIVYFSPGGMYKYNNKNNDWKLWFKNTLKSYALNTENNELYAISSNKLLTINANTNQIKQAQIYTLPMQSKCCSIVIKNTLHSVCREGHYIWDRIKQSWLRFNRLILCVSIEKVIYIKSKESLFIMTGGANTDMICYLTDKKTKKICKPFPPSIRSDFGAVITANDKYIIIFGGWCTDRGSNLSMSDLIYFWDLDNNKVFQSYIRCPLKGTFHAALMDDDYDLMLIYGFLRCKTRKNRNIPKDIVNTLVNWCKKECAHLLDIYTKFHWKIDIQHIVSCRYSSLLSNMNDL